MTAPTVTVNVWHLYRNGEPYTLKVFGPYAGSQHYRGPYWDVEVHEDHVAADDPDTTSWILSRTLERDTHIVSDMFDAVDEALNTRRTEREDYERNPFDPPEFIRTRLQRIGNEGA